MVDIPVDFPSNSSKSSNIYKIQMMMHDKEKVHTVMLQFLFAFQGQLHHTYTHKKIVIQLLCVQI